MLKTNFTIKQWFLACLCLWISTLSFAQFDKKVTLNVGGGAFLPTGAKIDADKEPYIFTNFTHGYQLMAGGQYNLTPNFSIGLNVMGSLAVNYKNPLGSGDKDAIIKEEEKGYSSYLTNIGLGADVKYKLFPTYKINPYVFGEISGNYYYGQIQPRLQFFEQSREDNITYDGTNIIRDKYMILRYNAQNITPSVALGLRAGLGVDYKVSDTFTFFLQAGFGSIFSQNNINLRSSMDMLNAQLGLRFSIFKSKSIL